MKVWIHINGVQEGPFELNNLPLDRMTPETPVWYEGMPYWEPAGKAVLTSGFFNHAGNAAYGSVDQSPTVETVEVQAENYNPSYNVRQRTYAYAQNGETAEKCPPTYMVWSMLFTILCCNPIGIIPIILGTTVTSKYRNYDVEGAKRRSETTAWWVMITIVTSLILLPFSMLMAL